MIRKGTKLVALKDFSVTALVHWHAPMTSDLKCVIPRGTVVIAFADPVPLLGAVACVPADKENFEQQQVPENILEDPKFAGISFVFSKRVVEDNFSEIAPTS